MKRVLFVCLVTCHTATEFASDALTNPEVPAMDEYEFHRRPIFERCTAFDLDLADTGRSWEPIFMSATQAVHRVNIGGRETLVSCHHNPVCFEQIVRSPTLDFGPVDCIDTSQCCKTRVLN